MRAPEPEARARRAEALEAAPGTISEALRAAAQRLQERYLDAVDSRDMAAWLACFARDGAYFVQGADNAADALPVCLMMDDCYERLQDRVTFVNDVWPGAFEDYQTRHFIQPLVLEPCPDAARPDARLLRARTNVSILATDARGRTSIFLVGQYRDLIRVEEGEALFRERRMIMDTFATPGVVVYPV